MVARFIQRFGNVPDLARPRTYPELMLWRKIFDRNPLFVTFTDKLAAKDYIRSRAPELPTPKTLWAGDAAVDIPPEILSGDVIVKTNNAAERTSR